MQQLSGFFSAPASPAKRVLVTGAAGFIGSHSVDLLLEQGHEVMGIDDLSTGHLENLEGARMSPGFKLVEADMLRPGLMDELVEAFRPDAVIHLAGLVSVALGQETPMRNFELNVTSTQLVADAARRGGVGRVVFASSAAVYGEPKVLPLRETMAAEPKSNYGAAKRMSEVLLAGFATSYGMTCVCHRYFNVFGPRQDPRSPYSGVLSIFAERFARGEGVTIFGDGQQSRDFISVRDVARANVMAATLPEVASGNYNLCTNRRITLEEVVARLGAHYRGMVDVRHEAERAGDIRHSQGDHRKARQAMGFRAMHRFEDALEELIRWMDDAATEEPMVQAEAA